jgi:ABC-type lipoprotein export system ATPase subunit
MGGEKQKIRVTNRQVADFLQLFDNDPHAAMQEIRSYVTTKVDVVKTTTDYVPNGPLLIAVRNLEKRYSINRQKVMALDNVSLDVYAGEFLAITGASGSGKSTLLQLMGGLDKPTNGGVIINNMALGSLTDRELSEFRSKTIGFIFQFFYLQPFLRLGRNLEVPGMFRRVKHSQRQKHVEELAETVGIADRLQHFPKELSGGQIQRAAIVRALLNNPKVILADEPTGNLDSVSSAAIIALFEKIRREYGTTIVIATHDAAIARQADRVIRLQDGGIVV